MKPELEGHSTIVQSRKPSIIVKSISHVNNSLLYLLLVNKHLFPCSKSALVKIYVEKLYGI